MKNKRKLTQLLLVLLLAILLAACGGGGDDNSSSDQDSQQTTDSDSSESENTSSSGGFLPLNQVGTMGQGANISGLIVNDDSTLLLATVHEIRVYSLDDLQNPVNTFGARMSIIQAMDYYAGKVVVAYEDGFAFVYDLESGEELAVLQGHEDVIKSVSFNADGTLIATSSRDKTVRLWNGETFAEEKVLEGHTKSVNSAAFSPDGAILVTTSDDDSAIVWDVATGEATATLLDPLEESVVEVVFNDEGTLFATASWDGALRIRDATTNDIVQGLDTSTAPGQLSFTPDGQILTNVNYQVSFYDAKTGQGEFSYGFNYPIKSVDFFDDGNKMLIVTSYDVQLRDLNTRDTYAKAEYINPNSALAFNSDASVFASGLAGSSEIYLWDFNTLQPTTLVDLPKGGGVVSTDFNADDRLLVANNGAHVMLLDDELEASAVMEKIGDEAFYIDEDVLASTYSGVISYYAVGAEEANWTVEAGSNVKLAVSPDRMLFAHNGHGQDQVVRVFAVADGTEQYAFVPPVAEGERIDTMLAALSNEQLAVAHKNMIYLVAAGEIVQEITVPTVINSYSGPRVNNVVLSPDGKWLAFAIREADFSGPSIRSLRVINIETGAIHKSPLPQLPNSLLFTPQSDLLLTQAQGSGIVRIWDFGVADEMRVAFEGTSEVAPDVTPEAEPQVTEQEVVTIEAELLHQYGRGKIVKMAVSPDQANIAVVVGSDILLYEADALDAEPRIFSGHTELITDLLFSPDSTLLSTASDDFSIRLWDVASGESVHIMRGIRGHYDIIHDIEFNADGTLLVSGSEDETIRIWDVASGERLNLIRGEWEHGIKAVAFTPDDSKIVFGEGTWRLRVIDIESGEYGEPLAENNGGTLQSLVFSPDGTTLAVGASGGLLQLWDIEAGEMITDLSDGNQPVSQVMWSADGKLVVGAGHNWNNHIHNLETGESYRLEQNLNRNNLNSSYGYISISPEGDQVIVLLSGAIAASPLNEDGVPGDQVLLLEHMKNLPDVAISPDGSTLVVTRWNTLDTEDGDGILVQDLQSGEQTAVLEEKISMFGNRFGYSPDGSKLFVIADKEIHVFDTATYELVSSLVDEEVDVAVGSFDLTDDSSTMAVVYRLYSDETITFFDLATGDVISRLKDEALAGIQNFDVNHDGTKLVFNITKENAIVIDLTNGEQLLNLEATDVIGSNGFRRAVFSPDGKYIATTRSDFSYMSNAILAINLWDAESGELVSQFKTSYYVADFLLFNADGTRLAAGFDSSGDVRIWDIVSGDLLLDLDAHDSDLTAMAFDEDWNVLATVGEDQILKVWSLR